MSKTKSSLEDELGQVIADNLNKKFKASSLKTAYFLQGDDDAPTIVHEWVSTGSDILDLAISNRKHGGIPVGRVVEITGLEQSGKSLIAAHILANTQKSGGFAVFIDTENAASIDFMTSIGVDTSKMLYVPLETIEDIFEAIENIIEKVRVSDKDRLVTIVVDSIAGATTKTELAADFDKDGYATAKAIIISKAMRKITNMIGRERICLVFTNQLRTKLNAPAFSDPYTTPGGKAIPFHSSVRLRLTTVGSLTEETHGKKIEIGKKVKVKVFKNKMGPPNRECEIDVYYNSGIDTYSDWLRPMKDYGIATLSGAWYSWVNKQTGELIKFQSKDFVEKIMNNPVNKEALYDEIADKVIMIYRTLDAPRLDDVSVEEDDVIDE